MTEQNHKTRLQEHTSMKKKMKHEQNPSLKEHRVPLTPCCLLRRAEPMSH